MKSIQKLIRNEEGFLTAEYGILAVAVLAFSAALMAAFMSYIGGIIPWYP